jgi:hypothetical protein
MPFTSPWMEGSSNYVLTVVFLARYLFHLYACSARLRKLVGLASAVLFVVDKSWWGVIISYMYYDTLFVT